MLRHPPHPLRQAVFAPLILLAVQLLAPPCISGPRLITRAGGALLRGRSGPGSFPLAGGAVEAPAAAEASRPVGFRASRLLRWGAEGRSAPRLRLASLSVPFVRRVVHTDLHRERRAKENQRNDASLTGRVNRHPEPLTPQGGTAIANLPVAHDRRGNRAVLTSPRCLEEQAKGLRQAPTHATPYRHLAAAQARRMGTDHGSKRFQLYVVTQAVQFASGRPDDRNEQCRIPDGWQDVG